MSVVLYNLLSNTPAQETPSSRGHYAPDLIEWTGKRTLLLEEIATYDSDIVCVQELDESDYEGDFGTSTVALSYDGKVFKKRNTAVNHGFCIFY
ncbi:hypothetical protein BGZ72_002085 [Mortierella alpina]|nr:hypothetical protein BGZ72_002085 [Mortierella alpina]